MYGCQLSLHTNNGHFEHLVLENKFHIYGLTSVWFNVKKVVVSKGRWCWKFVLAERSLCTTSLYLRMLQSTRGGVRTWLPLCGRQLLEAGCLFMSQQTDHYLCNCSLLSTLLLCFNPSFCPILAVCDFYIFSKREDGLKVSHFKDEMEVQVDLHIVLQDVSCSGFQKAFQTLQMQAEIWTC